MACTEEDTSNDRLQIVQRSILISKVKNVVKWLPYESLTSHVPEEESWLVYGIEPAMIIVPCTLEQKGILTGNKSDLYMVEAAMIIVPSTWERKGILTSNLRCKIYVSGSSLEWNSRM